MLKQFLGSVFVSLIVVGVPSVALSILLTPFMPFWLSFLCIFVIVWAGISIPKSILKYKEDVNREEAILKQIETDNRNIVTITCPCQQNKFNTLIHLNEVNEYVCDVCKNSFFINVDIEPILKTTPVNLDNAYKVFEQLSDIKKELP